MGKRERGGAADGSSGAVAGCRAARGGRDRGARGVGGRAGAAVSGSVLPGAAGRGPWGPKTSPPPAGCRAAAAAPRPRGLPHAAAARVVARGDVLLESGARRVLVRRDAGPEVIRAVVTVAQDLAAKGRPYAELDARFAGQVIVRRKRGPGGANAG